MTTTDDYIDIFIPSYHRPENVKTAKYFVKMGYPANKIHVFIDSEADDKAAYEANVVGRLGCKLHVFDMTEARKRYDYVHRAPVSRRSAGQARNMFFDFARVNGIDFYVVQDDDTQNFQVRPLCRYKRVATLEDIDRCFRSVRDFMKARNIGVFGLPQTGDIYINAITPFLFKRKVMNTTFYNTAYVYRGERGVQDNDTSLFVQALNEGYFIGTVFAGLFLLQAPSATVPGGLTDLYHECKLLNKSLVTVIQQPSAIHASRQVMNGGRLHHSIEYRHLAPMILRNPGGRDNIAWDTYEEDVPFTNEPRRSYRLNRE